MNLENEIIEIGAKISNLKINLLTEAIIHDSFIGPIIRLGGYKIIGPSDYMETHLIKENNYSYPSSLPAFLINDWFDGIRSKLESSLKGVDPGLYKKLVIMCKLSDSPYHIIDRSGEHEIDFTGFFNYSRFYDMFIKLKLEKTLQICNSIRFRLSAENIEIK